MPDLDNGKKTFATEEDQFKALKGLEERMGRGELVSEDEIAAIRDAEIGTPEAPASDPKQDQPTEPKEVKPEEKPPEAPKKPRKWEIDETMIPQDAVFYDKTLGKERPIWSFGDGKGEDIVKTLIHGQRRIHDLEQRLEKAFIEGQEKVTKETADKVAKLEKELADARKGQTQQVAEAQRTVIATQGPGQTPAEASEVDAILKDLDKFDPTSDEYDVVEHNKALTRAVREGFVKIRQETLDRLEADKIAREKAEESRLAAQKAEQERREATEASQKAYHKACQDVDEFVSKNGIQAEQTFAEMSAEAEQFHTRLAQAVHQKYAVTQQEIDEAVNRYQVGVPDAVRVAAEAGIVPPKGYAIWDELNQIEAIRSGYVCDPVTKKWSHRADVRFPDMESAQDYFERITGRRAQKEAQQSKVAAQKVVTAINRRDTGILQMDASRVATDGSEAAMTEEDANNILLEDDKFGMDNIIREKMLGRSARFVRHNQARERLGLGVLTD